MGWSPDGRYLMFASNRTGSLGLWTVPVADGKAQGVPVLVRSDIGSSWSLGVSRSGALYTWKKTGVPYVQISGLDLRTGKLTGPPTGISQRFIESRGQPSWSMDGKQLAYNSCGMLGGGPCSLFVQSLETGRVREMSTPLDYFGGVHWSPNGKEVLLGGRIVYRMNVETGEASVVLQDPDNRRHGVQWSADGKSVYYRLNEPGNLVIVERNLASSQEHEIVRLAGSIRGPFGFSPNGSLIAVISTDGSASSVVVISTSGGAARKLLLSTGPQRFPNQGYPMWTPDGRAVLVVRTSVTDEPAELWEVPVDGSAPRKLQVDLSNWTLEGVALNPDGKHLAFVASAAKSGLEVWALENFLPAAK
jgi:Tol biopolymer transport system component